MPEATPLLIFTTSFVVALSGATIPGPFLAFTVSQAAGAGFRVGPLMVVGHALAELVLITALALGLREVAQSTRVAAVIGLVGGVILVIMAAQIIRKAPKAVIPSAASADVSQHKRLVFSGFLLSVTNPGWFIWWGTLGTAYMFWSLGAGVPGIAAFSTGHILADLGWYGLVALMVSGGRRFMRPAVYRGILLFCGLMLLVLGVYFFVSGAGELFGQSGV